MSTAQARNKYNARQTVGDDGKAVYDSRLEAQCARVLDLLERQGRILGYQRQRAYVLAPARNGLRACSYVADFLLALPGGSGGRSRPLVIEAKGVHTPAGKLKLRWFAQRYPHIPLRVVRAPEEIIAVIEEYEHREVRVGQRGEEATQRGAVLAADGACTGEHGSGDPGPPAHAALPLRRL